MYGFLQANVKQRVFLNLDIIYGEYFPKYPVTLFMDVYKENIQSCRTLDKLKLRIVVRGNLQNKEIIGDTWDPTASMRTMNYFLEDSVNHKARLHQLDCIGVFLQANVKQRVFLNLDIIYGEYFPKYSNYLEDHLRKK